MDKVDENGFNLRLDEEKSNKFHLQGQRLLEWRKSWADICNEKLEEKGLDIRIDHQSFKERGIDRIPTIHRGKTANALEKRGIKPSAGNKIVRLLNLTKREKHCGIAKKVLI